MTDNYKILGQEKVYDFHPATPAANLSLADSGLEVISGTNYVSFSDFLNLTDEGGDVRNPDFWKILILNPDQYIGQACRIYFRTVTGEQGQHWPAYFSDVQISAFEIAGNDLYNFSYGDTFNFEGAEQPADINSSSEDVVWRTVANNVSLWRSLNNPPTASAETGRLFPPLSGDGGAFIYSESSSPVTYSNSIWGRSFAFVNKGNPIAMLIGIDAPGADIFEMYIAPSESQNPVDTLDLTPGGNKAKILYEAPENTYTSISSISVINSGISAAEYSLGVSKASIEANDLTLLESETMIPTRAIEPSEVDEIVGGIALSPGDKIKAYSESENLIVQVYGVEIS